MTIFKVFRLEMNGSVSVSLVEAGDWAQIVSVQQFAGSGVMFKIEAVGTTDMLVDFTSGEKHM